MIYVGYARFIKQTRILPAHLKAAFLDVGDDVKRITLPNRWEVATNPGVIKFEDGYLMVYRAEYVSFWDYLRKQLTFHRNKVLGLCFLDEHLSVISKSVYLSNSAPGIKKNKMSPNDPRVIECQGRVFAFYNDRAYVDKVGYVRKMYMCEVFKTGFGDPKLLHFEESTQFTEKGKKIHHVEKNWTPFVFENELYLVYLIEPQVIIKLDRETGNCTLVQENPLKKVWDLGIARGGTPCVLDREGYLSFFHSPVAARCLGHAHPNAYVMGAYWFSAKPPFAVIKRTLAPLASSCFYTGWRKFIYPTSLIDLGDAVLVFYGKDDQEMWAIKIAKERLHEFGNFIE